MWRVEHGPGQHWVCMQPFPPRRSVGEAGIGGSVSRCSERGARFAFDLCLDARVTNQELFEQAAKSVVQAAVAGSTASILAYGQTSSGKTHSVLGTPREPGILPMAAEEIFGGCSGRRAEGRRGRVSYYEIFNERVTDLLAPSQAPAKLPVKEGADRGFYVQGLREAPVRNSQDVLRLVDRGEEKRRYAQTRWNDYSSRSHVIFTLQLEEPVGSPRGDEAESPRSHSYGKLNIVDLAGCENHKHESSDDGRHINRSLFFLGEVISRLCVAGGRRSTQNSPRREAREPRSPSRSPSRGRDKNPEFIPYRDSKLTQILRSSLGGDAVTLLLVTVHPAADFVEQSLTSLRFASKAKCVENHVGAGAEQAPKKVDRSTIDAQQKIIEGLKEKLRLLELERGPSRGSIAAPPAVPQQPRLPIPSLQEQGLSHRTFVPSLEMENVAEHPNVYPLDAVKGHVKAFAGETLPPVKASQPPEAAAQPWTLQKELHGLRTELAEKEQELATKARLLSERERQVGLLREQLEVAARSGQPLPEATHKYEAPEVKPSSSASCDRPGPPDEGGGLPVIDLDGWAPVGSGSKLHSASGQSGRASPPTQPAPHRAPEPAGVSVSGSVFSRAEDITCLRSSSSYVARSLNLDLPPPPPREAPAYADEPAPRAPASGQTQQDLVDKLVQLAVFQISKASQGGLPPPSNPDVQDTPRKNDASRRSRDVDLSEDASRPMRGAALQSLPDS